MSTSTEATSPIPTELREHIEHAEHARMATATAGVQEYVSTHPELTTTTFRLTEEVKDRLIFHIAAGNDDYQKTIREELAQIQAQLEALHERPTILHTLLYEEVILSYLMMRQCDASAIRTLGYTSTQALRRADTAHVRLLRSIRGLASLQKMSHFFNVNLGQQIVNI